MNSELLRRRLVGELRARGVIRSELVETAFLTVPRERFLAGVASERGLEAVYRDDAIVTKRDGRGMPLSSSSQPALMAEMLELLALRPGERVLEVGSGTGYNAALLAHIVGSKGTVTSVDIDAEVARRARQALRKAGCRASIVEGDGRRGHPGAAPYDRIIVTACADEIPTAWFDQLAEGGRLELPLRLDPDGAAIQMIPVLERRGNRLRSVALTWGGFMPLHGGDGGWRPAPAALSASRSVNGKHHSLLSISGAGLEQLKADVARELLAAVLAKRSRARSQGVTEMSGARPPLLLIYLLLRIPAARRVSVSHEGRLGVGMIDRKSLAVVSLRSPWRSDAGGRGARARWRLDAYGNDSAAIRLERLLAEWRALQRTGQTTLQVTAHRRAGAVPLRFAWSRGWRR